MKAPDRRNDQLANIYSRIFGRERGLDVLGRSGLAGLFFSPDAVPSGVSGGVPRLSFRVNRRRYRDAGSHQR